jgi:hypothetical protein
MYTKNAALLIAGLLIALPALSRDAPPRLTVVDEPFVSTVLRDNRIGLNPERAIKVLLPPGYARSKQRYPVVYFLHNAWYGPKPMIEDGRAQRLISDLENAVTHVLALLSLQYGKKTPDRAPALIEDDF